MRYYRDIADRASLEQAYSPSSCVTDLPGILGRYAAMSEAARASCPRHRTIQYGEDPDEAVDLFPAENGTPRPALIYIHGGYWQELSKREHSFPALKANAAGLTYIAVNYGLAPKVTLDKMVSRCRRAVQTIHDRAPEFGVDRDAIHLAGCSAGAHLAAMVALEKMVESSQARRVIQSLTLLSGIYDLTPLLLTYINDALALTTEAALRNSPHLIIDAFQGDWPPTFVAMGEIETDEFKRQSAEFCAAIRRRDCRAHFESFAQRNHFDLIFDLLDSRSAFGRATLRHLADPHGSG